MAKQAEGVKKPEEPKKEQVTKPDTTKVSSGDKKD